MSRELSNDTQTALEQIANGWGREPTLAHPDCLCGRRSGYLDVGYYEFQGRVYVHPRPTGIKYWPCPVHPKARR